MLFKELQNNNITYPIGDTALELVDVTLSIVTRHLESNGGILLNKMSISPNDTPESISFRLYGSTEYWWSILFINKIVDPYNEWYKSDTEIVDFCKERYVDINGIHHFEYNIDDVNVNEDEVGLDGRWLDDVDSKKYRISHANGEVLPQFIRIVTNLDYERILNDIRGNIKVIAPIYINTFTSALTSLINDTHDSDLLYIKQELSNG